MSIVSLLVSTCLIASAAIDCCFYAQKQENAFVRQAILLAQANCGPCQTSGPNKGKKRCCELVGGDWICRWVDC